MRAATKAIEGVVERQDNVEQRLNQMNDLLTNQQQLLDKILANQCAQQLQVPAVPGDSVALAQSGSMSC